ncbi:MAG: hypothetical protein ABSG43_27465 [Solirubrobacteraceae bacterium]
MITTRDGDGAIAALNRAVDGREVRNELDRANVLRQLAATARALEHDPGHWLRSDRGEHLHLPALRRSHLHPRRQAAGERRRGAVRAMPGAVLRADRRLTRGRPVAAESP